jgi:hypothetical protein
MSRKIGVEDLHLQDLVLFSWNDAGNEELYFILRYDIRINTYQAGAPINFAFVGCRSGQRGGEQKDPVSSAEQGKPSPSEGGGEITFNDTIQKEG